MQPKDNIGYLLHNVAFILSRQSDQVLQERLGIGFSQFKILMVLSWRDHVQQRAIANELSQTEASISRQIKLLQNDGLVSSIISPENRREHIITLTTEGERLSEKAMQLLNDYHAPLFARLDEKQQAFLRDILNTMNNHAYKGVR